MDAPTPNPWNTPTGPTRAQPPEPLPTSPDVPTTPQVARPDGAPFPSSLTNRYQVVHELGRGGMGVVYLAHDAVLGRDVAVKLLRGGDALPAEQLARFQREAHVAGSLDHPNIIKVHDFGQADGQHYLTMYLARGGSLAQHRDRYRDPLAAAELLRKVALAVEHAHGHGILHRDLKPHNILLGPGDEPLVADFGLAKFLDNSTQLTQSFVIPGTPAYMAPEQASGQVERVGVATDVWALGVILFELLTGEQPFQGRNREEMLYRILTAEVPRPGSLVPNLDPALDAIVMKCLRRELGQRYPSAGALADDLTRWLRTHPTPAPRRRTRRAVLAGLGVAAVGGFAAWLVPRFSREHPPGPPGSTVLPLLDRTGPLVPLTWLIGEEEGKMSKHPGDGAFQVEVKVGQVGMIQLRETPPWEHYRIEAHLRQDQTTGGGVGLFFAHRIYEPGGLKQQACVRLAFSDFPGGNFDLRAYTWAGLMTSNEQCSRPHPLQQFPEPREFRKIAVTVGEGKIALELDGKELEAVETRRVKHMIQEDGDEVPQPWPTIARGSLGLWVSGTRLSCSSFTLQSAR